VTFDLLASPPGSVAGTPDELLAVLADGAYAGPDATTARAAFRARFCAWDDGHAAERVVRRVFLGEPVPGRRPELRAVGGHHGRGVRVG
jgi:CDP-glycerol glycerophosphotransferase (TagB/SpsB family)